MVGKGVRIATFGGRPQPGPMQSIGGIKGAQLLAMSSVSIFIETAKQIVGNATAAGTPIFTEDELAQYNKSLPVAFEDLPFVVGANGINFRNAFAPGNDEVPTQYIYQAADCRLFYTAESIISPEKYWAAAANAVWGNAKCAFQTPSIDSPSTAGGNSSTGAAHKALSLLLALSQGL